MITSRTSFTVSPFVFTLMYNGVLFGACLLAFLMWGLPVAVLVFLGLYMGWLHTSTGNRMLSHTIGHHLSHVHRDVGYSIQATERVDALVRVLQAPTTAQEVWATMCTAMGLAPSKDGSVELATLQRLLDQQSERDFLRSRISIAEARSVVWSGLCADEKFRQNYIDSVARLLHTRHNLQDYAHGQAAADEVLRLVFGAPDGVNVEKGPPAYAAAEAQAAQESGQ